MLGRDVAARVITKHGTSDLKRIVEAEGLKVETRHPWDVSFDDLFTFPLILVPRNLHPADFRTRVAHCLGHHFMHEGSQIWLRGFDRIWSWKQDVQAEEFAAYVTVPESENPELVYMNVKDVARQYRITEELAELRLRDGAGLELDIDLEGLQGRLE